VTYGGNNFNEFPENWPNFVYLLVDPGFYPLPLKLFFLNSSTSIWWTPVTDTTDKETNERTDGRTDVASLRPSVRLLDGVWNYTLALSVTWIAYQRWSQDDTLYKFTYLFTYLLIHICESPWKWCYTRLSTTSDRAFPVAASRLWKTLCGTSRRRHYWLFFSKTRETWLFSSSVLLTSVMPAQSVSSSFLRSLYNRSFISHFARTKIAKKTR